MNLRTLEWDDALLADFGIPRSVLPRIVASSAIYGEAGFELAGVTLAGMLGDQQAALVGQACFQPGEAKNTYGTGCFLLMNTGEKPVLSTAGLVSTVAYRFGEQPARYALEGSIAITGAAVQWLRDNLGLIRTSAEVETLAASVLDNGDVYFVPAFSGLYAPYWKADARGVIAGLTRFARAGHLARAVLEATAYQTRDVLDAMESDSRHSHPRAARRWRDGGERSSDAVPVRHPACSGGPAALYRNHGSGCGLCGGAGNRVLARYRRAGQQMERCTAMDPGHRFGAPGSPLRFLAQGGRQVFRLVLLSRAEVEHDVATQV